MQPFLVVFVLLIYGLESLLHLCITKQNKTIMKENSKAYNKSFELGYRDMMRCLNDWFYNGGPVPDMTFLCKEELLSRVEEEASK